MHLIILLSNLSYVNEVNLEKSRDILCFYEMIDFNRIFLLLPPHVYLAESSLTVRDVEAVNLVGGIANEI